MCEFVGRMPKNRATPEPDESRVVHLVYVQHDDGSEPLVCAVFTEREAAQIEIENSGRPGVKRTSWETHTVVGGDSWTRDDPIYVVVECPDQAPVAIGVYAQDAEADDHVARHESPFVDVVPMRIVTGPSGSSEA